jgi:glycosyltransferase involved in cell wall biosynthesis
VTVLETEQRPQVLMVTPDLPPGGVGGIGSATLHLALGLKRIGCQVRVITWLDRDRSPGPAERAGIEVFRFPNPLVAQVSQRVLDKAVRTLHGISMGGLKSSAHGWSRDVRGAVTMLVLARQGLFGGCDVVAAPEWGGACYVLRSPRVHGVRVAMVHGSLWAHRPRYASHFRIEAWDERLSSWLERRGIEAADVVTAPSEEAADDLRRFLGIRQPIAVVPNCIDLQHLDKATCASRPVPPSARDEFRVVFTGRVTDLKGADTLDEVVRILRSHSPTRRIRVVVVGTPDKTFRYAQLPIPHRDGVSVDLLGPMPMDGVLRQLARAHAYILPSRAETFCMAVLEAMAVGLPILAAPSGAIPLLVQERDCGYVIDADDPEGYAAAVLQLADNEALRSRMAEAARATVGCSYDSRIVAKKWLEECGVRALL